MESMEGARSATHSLQEICMDSHEKLLTGPCRGTAMDGAPAKHKQK